MREKKNFSKIFHKHFVFRTDNINSLQIMSNLAVMMADFNTVGKIMAESIIMNDEDAVELENIDIVLET